MYIGYVYDRNKLRKNINLTEDLLSERICLKIISFQQSNSKRIKRVIVLIALGTVVWFNNLESSNAIGLSMPPTPMHRMELDTLNSRSAQTKNIPRTAPVVSHRTNKIILKNEDIEEFDIIVEKFMNGSMIIDELILELRGGGIEDWVLAFTIIIAIVTACHNIGVEGFPLVGPNSILWGLGGPQLQPRSEEQKVGGRIRVYNSNQVLTIRTPTCTQVSTFVKQGKIDLWDAYQEVCRRTSQCDNYSCSFERFKALLTKCGKITPTSTREAITALQLEAESYVKNVLRTYYGILGIDFLADGTRENLNITHLEIKGPVGSKIRKAAKLPPSITKQGKKIGQKIVYQKNLWTNKTKLAVIVGLNPNAPLPESRDNILTVIECFDVPMVEKPIMGSAVTFGTKDDTNIVFLNNVTNI